MFLLALLWLAASQSHRYYCEPEAFGLHIQDINCKNTSMCSTCFLLFSPTLPVSLEPLLQLKAQCECERSGTTAKRRME